MKIPVMRGIIERRILANWRVEPSALAAVLPEPFRPLLVDGWGVAGICLIRLKNLHPAFLSAAVGISSENAAHRIAVQWEQDGQTRQGVYIPRRDTDSRLSTLVGGRLFPGVHHHARFDVRESAERIEIALQSDDGESRIVVAGNVAKELPRGSIFKSLQDASDFFEGGSLGHSVTHTPGRFDGLELRCRNWAVQPFEADRVESSFFDETSRFGKGSAVFDCALLMRGVEHEWHGRDPLCCGAGSVQPAAAV